MRTRSSFPVRQTTAGQWLTGHKGITVIISVVVFLFIITPGLLLADQAQDTSDARDKLLAMVTGDISRSLAVENSTEPLPAPLPLSSTSSSYPTSALYAVGASFSGQLGIGTSIDTHTPILVSPNTFGGPVATGYGHTLVTDSEGNLWVTGDDNSGQFGDGPVNSSTMNFFQTSDTDIKSVAAGSWHSLILTRDGTVMGTGEGSSGQLANGGVDTDIFAAIDVTGAVKVAANYNDSFLITDAGELFGFGQNMSGELGVGSANQTNTPTMVLPGGVVDVAPAVNHTLVLMADGSVMAMGLNSYGEFGDGTTDSSFTPKLVIDSGVKAIAAGNQYSLFLMSDGSLQGVGLNSYGNLGLGDTAIHATRQTIATGGVSDIAAGRNHSLYVTNDGALMAMGNNSNGQLGLEDFSPRLSPDTVAISGIADVTAGFYQTFFVQRTLSSIEIKGLTEVYSGANATFPQATANFDCYGHWSDGSTSLLTEKAFWAENSDNATFELNSGILDITDADEGENIRITASYLDKTTTRDITVVRPPFGSPLYGAGYNAYSQLGLDTTINQGSAQIITDSNVIAAAGGQSQSLYVLEDGSVFTMGDNSYGQLGTGDTVPRTTPVQITSLTAPAIDVSAGDYHSLVIFRDGSLYAMGRNSEGQLGDSTQFNRKTPIKIRREGVIQADGGAGHSVFLTADGEVWTVGRNLEGQLGNNSTLGSDSPFMAYDMWAKATTVAAGNNHTIFKTENGEMWGMGDNSLDQLGLGSVTTQVTPTLLVASSVANIAAGANHSIFSSIFKGIYLTGNNTFGQLGTGNTGTSLYTFTQLAGFSDVTNVYAGGNFSMFRDGENLFGMGDNSYGQLANGTFSSTTTPIILTISDSRQLALGYRHTLFMKWLGGDLNDDLQHSLKDVIIGLQTLTGEYDGEFDLPRMDINGDSRVGLPEVLFNLKKCAAP